MSEYDTAYQALENAISAFLASDIAAGEDSTYVPVDAVLIIGSQRIDDNGDRRGCLQIFPRNGSQPLYITTGLVTLAKENLTRDMTTTDDE